MANKNVSFYFDTAEPKPNLFKISANESRNKKKTKFYFMFMPNAA